jgi:hypothetical protein
MGFLKRTSNRKERHMRRFMNLLDATDKYRSNDTLPNRLVTRLKSVAQKLDEDSLKESDCDQIFNKLCQAREGAARCEWAARFNMLDFTPNAVKEKIIADCRGKTWGEKPYWLVHIKSSEARAVWFKIRGRRLRDRIARMKSDPITWGKFNRWGKLMEGLNALDIVTLDEALDFIRSLVSCSIEVFEQPLPLSTEERHIVGSVSGWDPIPMGPNRGPRVTKVSLISGKENVAFAISETRDFYPRSVDDMFIEADPIPHLKCYQDWQQYNGPDSPSGTKTMIIVRVSTEKFICKDIGRRVK